MPNMPNNCAECGARLIEGTSCQSIFVSFLQLEYTDPAYGEVHFLTVACFMIQHGRYSDEALAWIQPKLRAYLEKGLPVEQLRRQAAKETGQNVRSWKVTRQPGEPPLPKINWSMTIADVASNYRDAESYRELVKEWARTTLEQMKLL